MVNCPTALASSSDAAQAVIEAIKRAPNAERLPPILTNWLGEDAAAGGRRLFREASIPTYESPTDAVKGFLYLWQHTQAQEAMLRTPPRETEPTHVAEEAARTVMRNAAAAGRSMLTEPEAKAVLSAYGIPTVATRVAASPQEVEAIAAGLLQQAPALAVKILSKDISHKSDVGGVRLGLRSAQEAVRAAEQMLKRVAELKPDARIEGFTVQPMVMRPNAHELLMGVYQDRLFGPMILFGAGGTATEIIHDTAVALPPLDDELARDLMEQTRIYKLLEGYRDRPPADLAAIAEALRRLSQLVVDCPAVKELDINPLLADETGVIALDAEDVHTWFLGAMHPIAGISLVAIESRKRAASRPSPPLPRPASGSRSIAPSQSRRFSSATCLATGSSSRFTMLLARERPMRNSIER